MTTPRIALSALPVQGSAATRISGSWFAGTGPGAVFVRIGKQGYAFLDLVRRVIDDLIEEAAGLARVPGDLVMPFFLLSSSSSTNTAGKYRVLRSGIGWSIMQQHVRVQHEEFDLIVICCCFGVLFWGAA